MVIFTALLLVFSVILTNHRSSAIVGGSPVNIKDVKWAVALIHEKSEVLVCTAALIELDWVITAARCVEKFGIHDVLYVLAGIDSMENKEAGQKAYVMYWHIHPCYGERNAYDIALLKLSLKLNGTAASPIKLSATPWPKKEMYKRECDSTGWGSNMVDTSKKDMLRNTRIITAHGTSACPCTMRHDQKRLVCSTKGGAGLCMRDFGGVLVCEGSAVAVAHQLVSTTCSDSPVTNCRDETAVSSYVFICPFLGWIKQFVPSVPAKPASCFSPSAVSTQELLIWSGTVLMVLDWLY